MLSATFQRTNEMGVTTGQHAVPVQCTPEMYYRAPMTTGQHAVPCTSTSCTCQLAVSSILSSVIKSCPWSAMCSARCRAHWICTAGRQ